MNLWILKFLVPISLEKEQGGKLELIFGKLKLKQDMRVLDIGCVWGSLAKFAVEKYQVKVVISYMLWMLDKIAKLRSEERLITDEN